MDGGKNRVALLVETSLGSGREILRGIAGFAHEEGTWELSHGARGLEEAYPDWLRCWRGDGVIARIQHPSMADRLRDLKIPVVDVLGVCETEFPLVHVDDERIGRLAARHLREREFPHFAFFGMGRENWSVRRGRAFEESSGTPGTSFHRLELPRDGSEGGTVPLPEVCAWLRGLPKPVGILVCSDQRGLLLLEACRAEGLHVPDEIAVVGVDNDLVLCEISAPPLTSIRGGHGRVGREAARLLQRLMEGETPPDGPVLVPPRGIVLRESSDANAVADPAVARGIRFLRDHLAEPVTNETVARSAGLSRTMFQQRFRAATGLTIHEFLVRLRVAKAVSLIRHSDLTFGEIAARTGFQHPEYLGHVVKKRLGATPKALRMEAAGAAGPGSAPAGRTRPVPAGNGEKEWRNGAGSGRG